MVSRSWMKLSVKRIFTHFKITASSLYFKTPIELFLVPGSAPRLVYQRPWYVLSCLWDDAYKRTFAANR